ncbi:hypothetical protein D3C72_976080 [compost metagenome]
MGKVDGKGRIGIPVVPFYQVTDRTSDDGLNTFPGGNRSALGIGLAHGVKLTELGIS